MHGAKFLAITINTNNYAGALQFADWSKTAAMCLCTQAVWSIFLCAYTLVAQCVGGASMSRDDCDNVRRKVNIIGISP